MSLLATSDENLQLRQAIKEYDLLLRGLRNSLHEGDRKAVDLGLAAIQVHAWRSESADMKNTIQSSPNGKCTEQDLPAVLSRRYLGEASDITFFNKMKQALSLHSDIEHPQKPNPSDRLDSYEQDGLVIATISDVEAGILPSRATADKFLDIYFSTIHIAYPFIWEPGFREKYEAFWKSESLEGFRGPWLSILRKLKARW